MRNSSAPIPQYPTETDKSSVAAQFGLTNTNTHGHSGAAMDGGQIDYNNLINKPAASTQNTYGGAITSAAGGVFPTGWTVSVSVGNLYTVTHNLGTTSYSVVSLPASFSLQGNIQSHGANSFTVEFDNSTGTAFATNWDFCLTVIT